MLEVKAECEAKVTIADSTFTVACVDPKTRRYSITAEDSFNSRKDSIEVTGEARALLMLSILLSSEELWESGCDPENTETPVGEAYNALQESPLSNHLP